MDNKLMNFIDANQEGFITWQQQHTGQVVTNSFMLENAINALGWFTQNWQTKVLTDGTKLTNAETAQMIEGAINALTLAMNYWMDNKGTAVYQENKAFVDLLKYQMSHKTHFSGLQRKARKYLDVIGA
ncbi:hypothetical protein JK159_04380 [Weissella minor]|uniref:hypothetical protein n=1 Tax=Weissella minor TaxID=1620 RepID=UPI001BB0305D|nr:hypothetical protein [Weissella minor]MBS0949602.1 hypothetical protein [Weissella minor]